MTEDLARPALNFSTQIWRWTEGKYYQLLGRVKTFAIGTTLGKPEWVVQLTREDTENGLQLVRETYLLTKMNIGIDSRLGCAIYIMPIPIGYEIEPGEVKLDNEVLSYCR